MGRFKKFCHLESCKEPFESDSRNEKYHSPECKEAAKKIGHSRQKRRRAYHRDSDNRRAQSMSRSQAREATISEQAIGCCVRCGRLWYVAYLEAHHRDGDPFNNTPENRVLVDKACHSISDNEWRKAKEANQPIPDMRNFRLDIVDGEPVIVVLNPNMMATASGNGRPTVEPTN